MKGKPDPWNGGTKFIENQQLNSQRIADRNIPQKRQIARINARYGGKLHFKRRRACSVITGTCNWKIETFKSLRM